jgi:hypothetical protein
MHNLSASFVAKCQSSEIFIANIRECLAMIMEDEEQATPHKPADLKTWRLRVRKVFADPCGALMGVAAASRYDCRIDTALAAMPPQCEPDRI